MADFLFTGAEDRLLDPMAKRWDLVRLFAEGMLDELVQPHNQRKGDDWLFDPPEALEHDLLYHTLKLVLATRAKDSRAVREYSADVGNCAAMLADKMNALDIRADPRPDLDQYGSVFLKRHAAYVLRNLDDNLEGTEHGTHRGAATDDDYPQGDGWGP